MRGDNAHHILESCFKSFARAFRAALDALGSGGGAALHGCAPPAAGPLPPAAPPPAPRRAERRRATKETTIEVRVDLDAPWLEVDAPRGAAAAWDGA